MSTGFSDDELRDLITSAGRGSGAPSRPDGPFGGAPMSYDFRRPQPVDKAASRLVEGVHEQFARLVSGALGSALRLTTDVDLAFTDQTTYSEFTLALPSPCCAYSFTLGPTGGSALMHLSPDLVSAVIDRSFGGKGSALPGDPRQLTQIETNVLNKLEIRTTYVLVQRKGPMIDRFSSCTGESNLTRFDAEGLQRVLENDTYILYHTAAR